MFSWATALVFLGVLLPAEFRNEKECDPVLRSVRMEVSPLMVHSLCRDAGNVTLVISCEQSVWTERMQGFCNSFDLNIGEAIMNHALRSDSVTLYLMKLDQTLDAARVVVLTSDEVHHYRISVWGHQNTRFVLTVENVCSESRLEKQNDVIRPNNKTTTIKTLPVNGTIPKLTVNVDQPLPEYSRSNNLPPEEQSLKDGVFTKLSSSRVRGGIKLNTHRSSFSTLGNFPTSIFSRPSTLPPRPNGLDNRANRLVRPSSSQQARDYLNKLADKRNGSPELEKLEWLENKKVEFERKMDYYQNVYPSGENISDYGDYSTEALDPGAKQTVVAQEVVDFSQVTRKVESNNEKTPATFNNSELSGTSKNTVQNVTSGSLINQVLNNVPVNENYSPAIDTKENVFISGKMANILLPSSLDEGITNKPQRETVNVSGSFPLFLVPSDVESVNDRELVPGEYTIISPSPSLTSDEVSSQSNDVTSPGGREIHDNASSLSTAVPKISVSTSILTYASSSLANATSPVATTPVSTSPVVTDVRSSESDTFQSTQGYVPSSTYTSDSTTESQASSQASSTPTSATTTTLTSPQSTSTSAFPTTTETNNPQTTTGTTPSIATTSTSTTIATTAPQTTKESNTPPITSATTSTATTTTSTTTTTHAPPTAEATTSSSAATTTTASLLTTKTSASTITTLNTTFSSSTLTTTVSSTLTPAVTIATSTKHSSSPASTTSNAVNFTFLLTLPSFPGNPNPVKTPTTASSTDETSKDDDAIWPVIIALVLGIPALVVVGIAVTVIHRRRRPNPQKVFGMKALRSVNSTPRLSVTSTAIRTTLRLSTTSVDV
ncbi:GPI-anchored protein PB15E9.01c [Biomphalaria pfeifferi]|uniref:GPI-anchored protein PB15E9.01c n=1 Tax=Biomphalaria pfeifferi TaxID=112525 RepID=A0AAD8BPA1_BIOPF|nr:GPI-anchored protein PB15E9.01c [Biomphalaria pfeifferi]